MREITYAEAVNEALVQEMERDSSVFVYGIGVPDHKATFGTTKGLVARFGSKRCFDTPIAEEAMTGIGFGAAINGLRPIYVHMRADFSLLAMNQLVNMISSYCYSTDGKRGVPITIRIIVGRGWGQGFQHSKTMHSFFAHVPGLKVVLPTTPYDAKGLMIAAIRDDNPVVVIEHRWLYYQKGNVPEELYTTPIGEPQILREGSDLTILATSWLNVEALKAVEILERNHVSVELIDVRSLMPLNTNLICKSIRKTGGCIIADNDWTPYGAGAELASMVYQACFGDLRAPIERIGFAFAPCPTARHLENAFYPNTETILRVARRMLKLEPIDISREELYSYENKFRGPF